MEKTTQLVVATGNAGKVREVTAIFSGMPLIVQSLRDYPDIGPIEECGATFAQNALIKARTVAEKTHCLTLADDSGLVVDALGGRPGIFSARYGADLALMPGESNDQRNIRKLLGEMDGVPEARRTCRFVACLALVRPDGREMTLEAHWEGRLLTAPRGENGFGYDPIFFDPLREQSAACMSLSEKNAISHRGKALRALLERLPHFLSLPPLPAPIQNGE
ncbi:MAG: RdgB/HAM1 family non-canonical purine NTP pyrophosphatase [Desulfovibrionaceae bacterium]|nr:RdgB/HAM1 family non-canonical purine NTP pyrophosphatase [Desulfovibrionaceae bacterium]